MKYYLDSCIWIDFCEDRFGKGGRHLGGHAAKLILRIVNEGGTVLFSESLLFELRKLLSEEHILSIFEILSALGGIEKVEERREDLLEARLLASERDVPVNDALHAVLARNNGAILISQDKHFVKLSDVVSFSRPEDII